MEISSNRTIEQFLDTEYILGSSFSFENNKILYASSKTGILNIYSISVNGGESVKLTSSTESSFFPISYLPNDDRFLFMSDNNGDEKYHIYLSNEDNSLTDLTPNENEVTQFIQWNYDGKSFFYTSNKRNPNFMDIYEMDINTFTSTLIFTNNEGYECQSISNDNRYIALYKINSANDSNIYLYNIKKGEIECITPHAGEIQYSPQMFSKDSQYLYYLTDKNNEFLYVEKYEIETGDIELLHKEDWDITYLKFSPQGNYFAIGIANDANTTIKIYDMNLQEFIVLPKFPSGQITNINISKCEQIVCFLVNSAISPNNIYVYNLKSNELYQITNTQNPMLNSEDLVSPQNVRYPSFDGLEIPALFYKPKSNAMKEKSPALIWVHGGPGGQSVIDFDPLFQYLCSNGIAILAVNHRGSSGYGKTFFKAADLKHGDFDLKDCIEAKKFLSLEGSVDVNKVGIMGVSYGGFIVLAALAFHPNEFKLGIDIFGVSNWERTLKSIPKWWESIREALYKKIGNPFTQVEYIQSISPLFHADKINKPLLVLQGENDPRVLKIESDEIVSHLKKNQIPVEYLVFSDEGHGFSKKSNIIKGYKKVLEFVLKYL